MANSVGIVLTAVSKEVGFFARSVVPAYSFQVCVSIGSLKLKTSWKWSLFIGVVQTN